MDPQQIAAVLGPLSPQERAAMLNQTLFGFDALVGLHFSEVGAERLEASLAIDERHVQPYGLVHGGVYAAMVETACSVGAAMSVMSEGKNAVGLENTTRFLRGSRPGTTLTIVATPKSGDIEYLTWSAVITDSAGNTCARGQVTLRCLSQGTVIAGEAVALSSEMEL